MGAVVVAASDERGGTRKHAGRVLQGRRYETIQSYQPETLVTDNVGRSLYCAKRFVARQEWPGVDDIFSQSLVSCPPSCRLVCRMPWI